MKYEKRRRSYYRTLSKLNKLKYCYRKKDLITQLTQVIFALTLIKYTIKIIVKLPSLIILALNFSYRPLFFLNYVESNIKNTNALATP